MGPSARKRLRIEPVPRQSSVRLESQYFRSPDHTAIGDLGAPFPYDAVAMYLIFDNDKKYGDVVLAVIEHMGIQRKQITPHSPWQNGVAER